MALFWFVGMGWFGFMGYLIGTSHESGRIYDYLHARWKKEPDNSLLSDCMTGIILSEHRA